MLDPRQLIANPLFSRVLKLLVVHKLRKVWSRTDAGPFTAPLEVKTLHCCR